MNQLTKKRIQYKDIMLYPNRRVIKVKASPFYILQSLLNKG